MTGHQEVSCPECPRKFELVPPADSSYSVPKEKPTSDDYLIRNYDCDQEGHRITIYWQKQESLISSSSDSSDSSADKKNPICLLDPVVG